MGIQYAPMMQLFTPPYRPASKVGICGVSWKREGTSERWSIQAYFNIVNVMEFIIKVSSKA